MGHAERKAMLGHKIRRFRNDQGLSQVEMAGQIGISPSYLNLIEHNQRPVTVSLLFKLGQSFDVDLKAFAEDDDARLAASLNEVLGDAVFSDRPVSERELKEFVAAAPTAAQAMMDLYHAYKRLWENAETLAHATGRDGAPDRLGSYRTPVDDVRAFLEAKNNHFESLEVAAEALWQDARLDRDTLFGDLRRHLMDTHGVETKVRPPELLGATLGRFDYHGRRIFISETLLPSARLFHLGVQAALLGERDRIDAIVDDANLESAEARGLLTGQLAGYFAGAVMMPYGPFLKAAVELRHDIERLRRRFVASFEQVCHRLTTMQRPGAKGVPFFFLRVDNAGNVSKRLDGGGFQFARFGGTCPRLLVHDVFARPGEMDTQVAELPDGTTYFLMAKALEPTGEPTVSPSARSQPHHAVALGCDISHAAKFVHADGLVSKESPPATPIGVSCRVCERLDCGWRAHPPVNHRIRVDPTVRRALPYSFER